ncbi:MAG TPA: SgcJ/EcaC family oxidoreductase [Pirellulales bacterium]|jgi:uncharacterized protein (TIGR02246 family)
MHCADLEDLQEHVMHFCHSRAWLLMVATAFVAQPLLAVAAPPNKPAATTAASSDEASLRKAVDAYREAVEHGDVDAIAAFWAPDADYVDHLGHAYKIQAAIAQSKRRAGDDDHIPQPSQKTETLAIRFLTADVAFEDGIIQRTISPGDSQSPGRYCAVWVKRDGQWLIDGVRESLYRAPPTADHFQDLAWMIGDWTAEGPHATAEATCSWGPDKAYILRQVKVAPKDDKPISATQWIGWDPVHQRIRSFVFDSHGGFGEGIWAKDGDAWIVTTSGVLPDGKHTSATNLYSRVDDNTAVWESVDEIVDGKPGLDFRLRATRKQAKK